MKMLKKERSSMASKAPPVTPFVSEDEVEILASPKDLAITEPMEPIVVYSVTSKSLAGNDSVE